MYIFLQVEISAGIRRYYVAQSLIYTYLSMKKSEENKLIH